MSHDLTRGNPLKLIVSFMIPVLLGSLFQQFYNLVDLFIVGRFNGSDALAAVGATGSLMFFVIGWISGMTNGFAILIAQSYGANDEKLQKHYIYMSAILCAVMAIIFTVMLLLFNRNILRMMKTPENIIEDALAYITIIYAGLVATVLYNLLSGILRAVGDSKTPLYFLIVSSLLNIGLDLLFVGKYDMGVAGAAIATVISQGVSAVLCFLYMRRKYTILTLHKEDRSFSARTAAKLLYMGIPMALQFSITAIGIMIVQSALNSLGSVYIAAYTTAVKVASIVTMPFNCMGVAMANYVGQNVGAGRMDRVRSGVNRTIILTLSISIVAAVIVLLFGRNMVSLFMSDVTEQTLEIANEYFYIVAWFYPCLSLIFIYRNTLQGLGDGFFPMVGGIFELIARGAVIFLLAGNLKFADICLADPVAWISALIPIVPVYYYRMNKIKKSLCSS